MRPVGESNEKQAHLLILDFLLDVLNSVAGLDIEGDGFASECFDENLHIENLSGDVTCHAF